jgi:UDP-2,3-diacylglucosamine pyrophosphatase LpxH
MTTIADSVALGAAPPEQAVSIAGSWRTYAGRHLTRAFNKAVEVPIRCSSRMVFFSDLHRGDGSRADGFARNRGLFLHALGHYYDRGFTYVEVGDGDELWKKWCFGDIQRAHGRVFDLMHRFDREGRLHVVLGNHDIRNGRGNQVDKDGILARGSLRLRHTQTGQQILVVHGHQADLKSDYLAGFGQLLVGSVWKRLQLLGMVGVTSQAGHLWALNRIERAIIDWVRKTRQAVICGHTHRPMSSAYGMPPYFNTGSCVFPGCITGLELRDEQLSLVSWFVRSRTHLGRPLRIERQMAAPPRALGSLSC